MANKLVVVSDMWGAKKGLWIASYFGYLQQYFDITFYDCQQLGDIDVPISSEENIHNAFVNGGIDAAVASLLRKETEPAHYLAFSTGGTIAWKAALKGLPVKSLTALSSTRIRMEEHAPNVLMNLMFGECDKHKPDLKWAMQLGVDLKIIPSFGHHLYTDEKIIADVCLGLLQKVTKKVV
ncbi:hypothetical protein GTQ34_10100 [Muricauda sp. JGD-17]|uniref:Alpha/beta hydrolase n=1 Tax=Flagellimonas ochracea TaxID=2696472 RepID=A0A964TCF0_9FLAO|nr:hypothetical protein [Allomuricauda ochracea]NAY92270.1 hypothetical protein [Allomuricauda ochracea]